DHRHSDARADGRLLPLPRSQVRSVASGRLLPVGFDVHDYRSQRNRCQLRTPGVSCRQGEVRSSACADSCLTRTFRDGTTTRAPEESRAEMAESIESGRLAAHRFGDFNGYSLGRFSPLVAHHGSRMASAEAARARSWEESAGAEVGKGAHFLRRL